MPSPQPQNTGVPSGRPVSRAAWAVIWPARSVEAWSSGITDMGTPAASKISWDQVNVFRSKAPVPEASE